MSGFRSSSPLRDFRVLLLLFVSMRLMLLAARPVDGLIAYGEFDNFYKFADITRVTGLLPYIGYWMEYPPLFVWPNLAIHQLTQVVLGLPEHTYYYVLGILVLIADCGNLWLLKRLAERLYGPERGLDIAWTYALIGVPLVFLLWNVEPVVTFFMLLSLLMLLEGKDGRSAVSAITGALIKVFPGLLVPVVWRFRNWKGAAKYSVIVGVLGMLAYLPFLIINPRMTLASLQALAGKSSWQSVWGLIDGNLTTGNFGPLIDRLDPAKAGQMLGQPPVVPGWLTLIAFGTLYTWLFTRPIKQTDRSVVAFFGATWCVFLLWSKGWSTPWMLYLIPLMLLVFPNRQGVLAVVAFALVNLIEWPLLLSRGMFWMLWVTVPLRTLMLAWLLFVFFDAARLKHRAPITRGELL